MNIEFKPVVNYMSGRAGYRPEAIVIHIAEGYLAGGYSWFNNPSSQVSSHYMVGRNGAIWQFVRDEDTAWHAGGVANPSWNLLKPGVNPNLYTIGIEHEGFTGEGWSNSMYNSTAELLSNLSKKFNIPLDRKHVIGHYEINSVSRINCPGSGVDLNRLINLALEKLEDPKMIKELQDKVNALQNEVNQLKSTNKSLSDTIAKNKQEYLKLESDNVKLANLNKELNDRIKQLENATSSQRERELLEQNSKLSLEIQKLQKNQSDMNKKIANLEKKLKESQTKKGGLFSRIFN